MLPVRVILVFAMFAFVPSCTDKPRSIEPALPQYPWQGPAHALRRFDALRSAPSTVTAELSMVLPHRGRRTRLDGVLVVDGPRRMRLRAYKAGRTAFDLTIDEHGYRMIAGPDGERTVGRWADDDSTNRGRGSSGPDDADAPPIDPRWFRPVLRQLGALGRIDGAEILGESQTWFEIGQELDGARVVRRIDKRTLVDLRLTVYAVRAVGASPRTGAADGPTLTIDFDDHAIIDNHPWPMTVEVTGRGDDQWCRLRFRAVELNESLAPAAFEDPSESCPDPSELSGVR